MSRSRDDGIPIRTRPRRSEPPLWAAALVAVVALVLVGLGAAVVLRGGRLVPPMPAAPPADPVADAAQRIAGQFPPLPTRAVKPGDVLRYGDIEVVVGTPHASVTAYEIKLTVNNTNKNRILTIPPIEVAHLRMTDDVGNAYTAYPKEIWLALFHRASPIRLRSEFAITEWIVFEKAVEGARKVTVYIPTAAYGGGETLRLVWDAHPDGE